MTKTRVVPADKPGRADIIFANEDTAQEFWFELCFIAARSRLVRQAIATGELSPHVRWCESWGRWLKEDPDAR